MFRSIRDLLIHGSILCCCLPPLVLGSPVATEPLATKVKRAYEVKTIDDKWHIVLVTQEGTKDEGVAQVPLNIKQTLTQCGETAKKEGFDYDKKVVPAISRFSNEDTGTTTIMYRAIAVCWERITSSTLMTQFQNGQKEWTNDVELMADDRDAVNLKDRLTDLVNSGVSFTRIVAIGLGSLTFYYPNAAAMEESKAQRSRSFIQLAAVIEIQQQLAKLQKTGPTIILQDRMYGDEDRTFLKKLGTELKVDLEIVDDPDAFEMTNQDTLLFSIGANTGYIYKPDQYPAAILSDEFSSLSTWARTKKDEEELQGVINSYTIDLIMKKGMDGFKFNDVELGVRKDLSGCA